MGVGFGYRNFTVNQDFGGGDVSEVDVDVLSLGLYGGYHVPVGDRNRVSFDAGFFNLCNKADIRSIIGGETFIEDRSEGGLRFRGAINYDLGVSDDVSARFGASYTAGDEDDADSNFAGAAFLSLRF